jgi:DNA-binding response OmpR family regulator
MSRILVAAGKPRLVTHLVEALRTAGFDTIVATDSSSAITMARSGAFDLLILDLELPDSGALGLLRQLRRTSSRLPVLLVAGADGLEGAIAGLEQGADDYLNTPFHAAELLARVRLRLRQDRQLAPNMLRHGDLLLDVRTRNAWTPLGSVELTGREFAVLETLVRDPGQVVSREQLLRGKGRRTGHWRDPAGPWVRHRRLGHRPSDLPVGGHECSR